MQGPNPETLILADILITGELSRRVSRVPDLQAENQAMRTLIHQMARDSEALLQSLVDTALELCAAGTTGVSLLETTPDGAEIFRWHALAGTLARHVGGCTPRNFSPCGACLDRGVPVLFSHPERYFTYFQEANTPIVEGLVLPLIADRHVFGTIWIISHDEERHFDSEDVRVMTSLADFTAALLLQQRQTRELLAANAALETAIAERKQAEARSRVLISNLPGGAAFVVDRDLRYLLAQGEALATAGFKPEDLVGRTIFEVLSPDLVASYEPMYRQALAGEPFEHEHQAHDRWYISRGTPLQAEDGEIYAVLVVSYDITDRKRAEVALRESEARLALELADARQLQFISSQLLQEANVDALYEQILKAAIALMRSDMGSMQMLHPDRNELQLLAWKGFDPASAAFWEWVRVDSESTCGVALRTGERAIVPDVETCEFMAGSGDLDSYRLSGVRAVQTTPLICRKGRVVGMISTHWQEPHQPAERELGLLDVLARQAADLIEQRQAEAALRESEERLRLALSAGEMGTWQYRFATDEHILDPTMRQLLGLPTGTDVIPLEDFLHIVHEDDRPQVQREIERALHEGGEIDLEFRVIWQDGSAIWLKDRGKAIRGEDDRPLFLTGAATDITQRKQAEIALQESEEKYRSLFQSMDEGYAVVEVLADEKGEWNDFLFLEVNSAFEQQTGMVNSAGRKATEILGTPNPAWAKIYGRVAETGDPVRFEENEATLDRVFDLYAFRLGEAGSRRVAVLFTDITERFRAEETLRESEEQQAFLLKFSDALRAQPDADAVANRALRMLSEQMQLDRCYIGVYRLADDCGDFTHQVGNDRVPPLPDRVRLSDFPEALRVAFDRTLAIDDVAEIESPIDTDRQNLSALGLRALVAATLRKGENNPLWSIVSVSAHPRRWTRGEIALVEEVTERTWAAMERARAEASLRNSEAKYRSLFDSIDEGFCIFEMVYNDAGEAHDFRYIETNPGFERQSGRRPQPGQTMRELFPEAEDMWLKDYAEVARTGQPKRFIDYHADLDRWFDVFVFPTSNGKNQLAALFSDVTDEKRAEEALRESEERLQKAISIETVGVLFFMLDGQIADANDTFLAMSGYSRDELRNIAHWQELTPPEFWDVTNCAAEELATLGKTAPYEKQHIRKDGSRWWGLFSPTRLKGSGRSAECVEFVIDISDRQLAEAQLRRAAEIDAFRVKLSDALRSLSDPAEIKYQAACVLGEHLGSDRAYYVEIDEARSEFVVARDWHQPGAPSHARRYPLSGWPMPWLVDGHPWVVRDVDTDPAMPDDQRASYRGNDIGALIVVPLIKDGRLVATLATNQHAPRNWTADEITAVQETAERTWAAVERAYAEAALRESEQKYRTLFDSIDEGLAIVEMIYDDQGEIVDIIFRQVNRAYERHGRVYDVVGRSIFDVIPGVEDYWLGLYKRVALTGESVREENYQQDVDRWFDVYFSRIDDNGRFVAIVFSDISDRKRTEVILRENEARQAFLLKLSDILQQLVQPNDIKAAAMRLLGEHLGVSRAQYHECDSRGEYYSADGVGYANGLPLLDLKYRIDDFGTFVNEDFAAGRPYRSDDLAVDPRISAEEREAYRTYQIGAGAGVPLIGGGKLVAILAIHDVHPHQWTDLEMDLIRETAERIWTPLDRARAEVALRESEAKYRSLFESINDGFALLEVLYDDDNRPIDCRFLEVSPSFEFQTGLPQAQGKTLRELIPSVEPDWFEHYHQALVTNAPVHFEIYQSYINIWFEVDVLPYGNPQDRQVAIVLRNINERKQAEANQIQLMREQSAREQERQRAETLAELDRAKTLFFSNVSHEFRTPLTLSLAPLSDALSDRTHPLDPVHRERLELVHRNSLRLLKLVNTLLDFSRIEAGRMEAVYEPTDLATYTTELASVFRSAIERAGLQLIVVAPPLPEPVFVDRQMWEKIVLNLLSNAFKFTFEGEIRVSLHPTDSNQVVLQIQDTGTGIAPEHLPHLFERFYQIRGTQARTHEGSGIGLALVNELVRLHGGTIEVNSTLGEGTCFTIALSFGTEHLPSDRLHFEGDRYPIRTLSSTTMGVTAYVEEAERWATTQDNQEQTVENAFERTTQTADSSFSTLTSARVLVVDDNADMREYLTRILSEHVQVEAVADGVTALSLAQERLPDLILSDVMMPGLDGFELLEALRASPRTREIPIILLSARAGVEAIVVGLEAGADDYLIKPFSAQELVSRVTAHLQMVQLRGEALEQERTINRRKDEFISVVSHELNTPLVAILGWTRLLRSSLPSPMMLNKALDTIERNATLQAKLVQDLLDISRISAGKLRLNPQPIELKPVLETAIATVTQTAADKGIHLTWQGNVTKPVVVMGDSIRLGQVFTNLLTNAIKFTPEFGSVRVELSVINDEGSADASIAEIRVTDTGMGIAADFLPHVFERFRQAEGENAAKGLGLGLAIASHIVELHNGIIYAESAGEGQGATFTVRLPLFQNSDDLTRSRQTNC